MGTASRTVGRISRSLRRKLRRYGVDALATLALAACALLPYPQIGYAVGLLTMLLLWRWRHTRGLGRYRLARLLVVLGALIGVARPGFAGLGAPFAVTGVLLVGLISEENWLVKALTTGRARTANLAVERPFAERAGSARTAYVVQFALIVLLLAFAAIGWQPWILLPVSVVTGLAAAAAVVSAWARRRRSAQLSDLLVDEAVERHAPRFMVHFSAPHGAEWQLTAWLPYLDMLEAPYIVVLREHHALTAVAKATAAPVVVAPSIAAVRSLATASMRTAFYVNNGMKNTHCVRFAELTHVQLTHGDADQPGNAHPAAAMYDRIFVAGRAAVDRYERHGVHLAPEKYVPTGFPPADAITVAPGPAPADPVVLYALCGRHADPAADRSSLRIAGRIVDGLLARGATVICRCSHHDVHDGDENRLLAAVYERLAADAARTGRRHRYGARVAHRSPIACLNAADAVVTDVPASDSGVIYAAKPLAVTDMAGEGPALPESFGPAAAAYVLAPTGDNLDEVLDGLLRRDRLVRRRAEVREYHFAATGPGAFLAAARECLGEPASGPAPGPAPGPAEPNARREAPGELRKPPEAGTSDGGSPPVPAGEDTT